MVTAFYGVKGGVGVTTVTAITAIVSARRSGSDAIDTLAVDTAGDLAAALGSDATVHADQPDDPHRGQGFIDWIGAVGTAPDDALERLSVDVGNGLRIIDPGSGMPDSAHVDEALSALGARNGPTIIDCGVIRSPWAGGPIDSPPAPMSDLDIRCAIAQGADERLLVVRPCYLGLRAVAQSMVEPTGVVVVSEPGRVLTIDDVIGVCGAPIVAEFTVDRSVARLVDAGLLTSRLPRSLARAAVGVLDAAL